MSAAVVPIRSLTLAERQAAMHVACVAGCEASEVAGERAFPIKRIWATCRVPESALREGLTDDEANALLRHACDELPPLDDGAAGRIELCSLVNLEGEFDVEQAISRALSFYPSADVDQAVPRAFAWLHVVGEAQLRRAAVLESHILLSDLGVKAL